MRLIDWLVRLPKDLDALVLHDIVVIEQERQMTYVPTYERKAWNEGMAEGVAKGITDGLHDGIAWGLRMKFSAAGEALMPEIRQIRDPIVLRRIMDATERATSVDEVRRAWAS